MTFCILTGRTQIGRPSEVWSSYQKILTYGPTQVSRGGNPPCPPGEASPCPGQCRRGTCLWTVPLFRGKKGLLPDGGLPSPKRSCCMEWYVVFFFLFVCLFFYLVSLFTPWNRAGKRLLLSSVHAHGAEDGFRADGALCGPGLVTVRLLVVHLLLVILAACRVTEQQGRQKQSPACRRLEGPGTRDHGWQLLLPQGRAFQAQRAANVSRPQASCGRKTSAVLPMRPG